MTNEAKPSSKGIIATDEKGRYVGKKDFTAKEWAFIQAIVSGHEPKAAAKLAGYSAVGSSASFLMKKTDIIGAIRTLRVAEFEREGAAIGYKVLKELALDKKVAPAARRSAASDLLKLGGYFEEAKAKQKREDNKTQKTPDEMSAKELRAYLDRLQGQMDAIEDREDAIIDVTPQDT